MVSMRIDLQAVSCSGDNINSETSSISVSANTKLSLESMNKDFGIIILLASSFNQTNKNLMEQKNFNGRLVLIVDSEMLIRTSLMVRFTKKL